MYRLSCGNQLEYAVQCVDVETFDWVTIAQFQRLGEAKRYMHRIVTMLLTFGRHQQIRLLKNGEQIEGVIDTSL